jgi:hypothetical protein
MRKAAERGEADPRRVNARVASVAYRMMVLESMERGTVPDSEVVAIVDEVLIPLMASRLSATSSDAVISPDSSSQSGTTPVTA